MAREALRLRNRNRNRIAIHREGRGLTQAELADRLGVTRVTVARWEGDENLPPPRRAALIARELRVRPRDLFPFDYA